MTKKTFLLLLLVASPALADDAAILRCRSITDNSARLACYDALVVTTRATPAVVASTPPAPAAITPTKPPAASSTFGLEAQIANKEAVDTIDSQIDGSFEGWRAKSNIRLANGQVWQISDDSARAHYIDNPKVRIRRGALGAFYLEIQGTNHSPRVKRIQ